MIGKVSPRGGQVSGLRSTCTVPAARKNTPTRTWIAGWRHPAELEPSLRHDGRRDFRHLSGLLQQTPRRLGDCGFDRPVWHCSVRAAPGDRMLSDDEWAQVACEIMHRTGLAPYGRRTRRSAGSRSATPPTTSTWSRCWPAKTAPGRGCGTTTTASAKPARPPRTGSGCAVPPRVTAPPRPADPGRGRRRPAATAGGRATPGHAAPRGRPLLRPPRQRARVLRPPRCRRHAASASGSAPAIPARSPATPSRSPPTPSIPAARSGTAAENSPPT